MNTHIVRTSHQSWKCPYLRGPAQDSEFHGLHRGPSLPLTSSRQEYTILGLGSLRAHFIQLCQTVNKRLRSLSAHTGSASSALKKNCTYVSRNWRWWN